MGRDRFADTHVDDGMRHSALVPTAEERREEQWLKDALAREARISANAARFDLAQKVLEIIQKQIADYASIGRNLSAVGVAKYEEAKRIDSALRDLFQREGIELKP